MATTMAFALDRRTPMFAGRASDLGDTLKRALQTIALMVALWGLGCGGGPQGDRLELESTGTVYVFDATRSSRAANVTVEMLDGDGRFLGLVPVDGASAQGKDFAFTNIIFPDGQDRVRFRAGASGFENLTSEAILIGPEEETNGMHARLVMEKDPSVRGTVSGTVQDVNGPVAGATVMLVDEDGGPIPSGAAIWSGQPDPDVRRPPQTGSIFSTTSLANGSYSLSVPGGSPLHLLAFQSDRTSPPQSVTVPIDGSEIADLTLPGGEPANDDPVIVSFTGTPGTGDAPLEVTFVWQATDVESDPLTSTLNFGDGSPVVAGSAMGEASHTYTEATIYTPILTVEDGRGGIAIEALAIRVTGATNMEEPDTRRRTADSG